MIDIYIEKKNSKDWILQNDLYFNLNTANEEMSKNEVDLLSLIHILCCIERKEAQAAGLKVTTGVTVQ